MSEWFEFLIGLSAAGAFLIFHRVGKTLKKLDKMEKEIGEIHKAVTKNRQLYDIEDREYN